MLDVVSYAKRRFISRFSPSVEVRPGIYYLALWIPSAIRKIVAIALWLNKIPVVTSILHLLALRCPRTAQATLSWAPNFSLRAVSTVRLRPGQFPLESYFFITEMDVIRWHSSFSSCMHSQDVWCCWGLSTVPSIAFLLLSSPTRFKTFGLLVALHHWQYRVIVMDSRLFPSMHILSHLDGALHPYCTLIHAHFTFFKTL